LFLADATTRDEDRQLTAEKDAAEKPLASAINASCSDMWRRVTHATTSAQVN
jgi:hypothetical protein